MGERLMARGFTETAAKRFTAGTLHRGQQQSFRCGEGDVDNSLTMSLQRWTMTQR
ncbi:ADP-ribosylglycohydrolase [Sesbania bispinosa]|nr:ADP-ribosylglycohydrolase [Sesbania bispinosa]